MYVVYIIQSEIDSSFYIGFSSNLEKRLLDHNSGKSRYTKAKLPWRLVYQEGFNSKKEAIISFLKNKKISIFT